MSGLALVFRRREGRAGDPTAALGPIMARLRHRGPDGADTCALGWEACPSIGPEACAALGHQHFWTTPEEVGERQPLCGAGARAVALDGRLDNRAALLPALGLHGAAAERRSDAALLALAYARWGEACWSRLLGPLAAAIWDGARERVVLARDALGARTLYYYLDDQVLVAASEVWAVLAHPAVPARVDERTLALYYALRVPEDGATFYCAVRELLPGEAIAVGRERVRTWRHWRLDPPSVRRGERDETYAHEFGALLGEAVRCRLRSTAAPAVSMSGGLDSTAVAALAARELSRQGRADRVRAISWVFDELTSCDERPNVDAMAAAYELDMVRIAGDDAWPLREVDAWPREAGQPGMNPYWVLRERTYRAAQAGGRRTLLSGWGGDLLYLGAADWLVDLIADRRLGAATRETARRVRRLGVRRFLADGAVRRIGGWLLDQVPGGRRIRPYRAAGPPAWLTPEAAALVPAQGTGGPGRQRRDALLGAEAARGGASWAPLSSGFGVEVRCPFRDRRLVSYVLSLPAHQLYDGRQYKHVLRNAMAGILPEPVRQGDRRGQLHDLYVRGLAEREWGRVEALLGDPEAMWPRYVRREWLLPGARERLLEGRDGAAALVIWQCVCGELWRQAEGLAWT